MGYLPKPGDRAVEDGERERSGGMRTGREKTGRCGEDAGEMNAGGGRANGERESGRERDGGGVPGTRERAATEVRNGERSGRWGVGEYTFIYPIYFRYPHIPPNTFIYLHIR